MGRKPLLAWALAASLVPAAARASCDASNQYSFTFNTATAATLNYANSYTYTATNTLGASLSFTISFATNGLSSSLVNSTQMPAINNLINDTTGNNNLMIGGVFSGRTTTITSGTRTITTNITFASAVRDVRIQLNDIDFTSNQYRDWIHASGTSAAGAYVPAITTPYTNKNVTGPFTDASSTLELGPITTPYTLSANEAVGTGTSNNTGVTNGTMYAAWTQPITKATLIYGNYPYITGENTTGQQAYGIQTITFCPMPALTLTKTSAPVDDPVNGTTNPKLIPGANVDYTLTLANTGGSPLDASTAVLADVLPGTVTFYNGDIDTVTAGTQNYVFTAGSSGLTLAAGNVTYSNNGGSSYAYTPAAGYDTAVNAVKFSPQGTMAANSSITIRFRVKIR